MTPQVSPEHYFGVYDSKRRFCSYWTQIEYVLKLHEHPVLEIGIGNRTVTDYLEKVRVPLVAGDFDPALRPDVVLRLPELPFRDSSFGLVMACQVLEHLPFDQFVPALQALLRVARQYVVVSLPHAGQAWPYAIHLPGIGTFQWLLEVSWFRRPKKPLTEGQHFWELDLKGYERKAVERLMESTGATIVGRKRVWDFPYHQFYVLRKSSRSSIGQP